MHSISRLDIPTPWGLEVDREHLLLDLTQMALDIGGILEPTPICDIRSDLIALYRRHWGDAIINVVSVLPWAGDTAKSAKFPGYQKTISRVTELTAKNPEFAKRKLR